MSHAKFSLEMPAPRDAVGLMSDRDLREVAEIEELCGLSRWGYEAYRVELLCPEAIMLVARHHHSAAPTLNGARLHGFFAARMAGDELHINNVAVRPAARRQGIGGALLRAAFEEAVRRGARMAILEVRVSNGIAQAMYLRHGFQIAGRRKDYYRTPPEDALVMTAALDRGMLK